MKVSVFFLFLTLVFCSTVYGFGKDTILISKTDPNAKLKGYKTENFWQIAVHGGFFIPVGNYLTEKYDNCPSIGAEVAYRVNTEVALYSELKFYPLSIKDPYGPASSYFESTIGTRFYFRHLYYRSSIFFEAGMGTFIFSQDAAVTPSNTYESKTEVRMGANAGVGCELVLTNSVYATFKAKMNTIFIPGSTTTFVSGIGGLIFRL